MDPHFSPTECEWRPQFIHPGGSSHLLWCILQARGTLSARKSFCAFRDTWLTPSFHLSSIDPSKCVKLYRTISLIPKKTVRRAVPNETITYHQRPRLRGVPQERACSWGNTPSVQICERTVKLHRMATKTIARPHGAYLCQQILHT